jgi:TonB family protein
LKVRDMPPVFPPGAVGGGGTVILEGTIGTDGQVQNARVLRGVRDTPAFDHAALSALEQWRYAPALLNGSPVEVVVTVTMNFTSR